MQRRAAIWILGVFCTFSSYDIKAIAGLIPIHLHLRKLSGRVQLRAHSLPDNHILKSLLEARPNLNTNPHCLSLDLLTLFQRAKIKGTIINMDNRFNEIYLAFDTLNNEFSPRLKIVDIFTNCFFFTLLLRIAKTLSNLVYFY